MPFGIRTQTDSRNGIRPETLALLLCRFAGK